MAVSVALVMSDLIDSTGTSERLGLAAQALWAEHDRMARALLARCGGVEVEKSDGFLLAFGDAVDATRYAMAYHRGLAGLPEPVAARVGIHVATVDVRSNSAREMAHGARSHELENWMARAVTSRLMSLARAGQTLASPTAVDGLAGSMLSARSHGHWRLQGVEEPLEVYEVGDEDTRFQSPADSAKVWRVVKRSGVWLPLREIPHSLPSEPDGFVGRDADVETLSEAMRRGSRLLTLQGIGGIGKTRLALRLGWQWLGEHPGGSWFCDLSNAHARDGLLYAVAQGLQITLDQPEPVAQVAQAIAARGRCLLVLDNFDRLTEHAGATVVRWMQAAPQAHFLVTTRQVLSLAGEHVFPLAPLAPADAVALFGRRAREAAPNRTPDDHADETIAKLVQMLDCLPLAIELAAARVRAMSPRQMLERMGQRFHLLAVPGRPLSRHATMRAALDWSWELLAAAERRALAQLTVFEGPFTLGDAEAVLDAGEEVPAPWVPDLLQSLIEKSMLRTRGRERFELLRNVQDYAAEHLATPGRFAGSGPTALVAAQMRHWRHYAALEERAILDDDSVVDNLVCACRRATGAGDASAAAGALAGSWVVLRRTGPFQTALDLAASVRRLPGLAPDVQTLVERVAGSADELLGHIEQARAGLDAALHLALEAGDEAAQGWARVALGEHLYKRGQMAAAREVLDRALLSGPQRPGLRCAALNALGTLEMRAGHAEAARTAYEAALPLAREGNDTARIGGLLGNLAILAHQDGQEARALDLYEQSLALTQRGRDRRWEGNTRCNLGLLLQEHGRGDEAESQFRQALAIAREIGHAMLEATVLCNLGIRLDVRGELASACTHHEQALEVALRMGDRRAAGQFSGYLGEALARCGRVAAGLERLAEGEALLLDAADSVSLGLLRCQRALAEFLAGRGDQARELLAAQKVASRAEGAGELRRAIERTERLMTLRV